MDDFHTTTTSPGIVANGVGYDPTEINAPGVTIFTLLMVGVLLSVFFGVTLYFEKFYNELAQERINDSPAIDLNEIHARENSDLTTYRMIDKSKGVVGIPIDQAMKALLTEVPAGKAYSTKDQIVKAEPAPGAPATTPAATGAAAPKK
ncbi:MAG TPA: hypothetical protein VGL82_19695 [Bryobacteraceae bacterium]|jgi:hypothetical protein